MNDLTFISLAAYIKDWAIVQERIYNLPYIRMWVCNLSFTPSYIVSL